jgi:hypothetical protein
MLWMPPSIRAEELWHRDRTAVNQEETTGTSWILWWIRQQGLCRVNFQKTCLHRQTCDHLYAGRICPASA